MSCFGVAIDDLVRTAFRRLFYRLRLFSRDFALGGLIFSLLLPMFYRLSCVSFEISYISPLDKFIALIGPLELDDEITSRSSL
jgi:hypothetical protein